MNETVQEPKPTITKEMVDGSKDNAAAQNAWVQKWHVPWYRVQKAIDQGYIYPQWVLKHYMQASFHGNPLLPPNPHDSNKLRKPLEYVNIWGTPGASKSSFILQLFGLLYKDWDTALSRMVLSRDMLKDIYAQVQEPRQRIPALCLDDLNTIIPKQLWQSDKEFYMIFHQFLNTIRTKVGTLASTLPNIAFTMQALGEMTTMEVIIYPNSSYKVSRYCWDTHPYDPLKPKFTKIVIEDAQFDIYGTPQSIWERYEEMRREIANQLFQRLVEYMESGGKAKADASKAIKQGLKINSTDIIDAARTAGFKGSQNQAELLVKIAKEKILAKSIEEKSV